jgi:putative molybdopterin biosynthesis protein
MKIQNNLAHLRSKRGIAAAELAAKAGVSRQTIYAMEAGNYVPNTAVALRLAQILEVKVEDLFHLDDQQPPPVHTEKAELLPGQPGMQPGQPVQLCRVDAQLVAAFPTPVAWALPLADAVLTESGSSKARVRILHEDKNFDKRLLVAGCDPGISVLARHLQHEGVELVVAHRNSSQALDLLKKGLVHVAGSHLRDAVSGESNLPAVHKLFPRSSVAVISFAIWEEGIVLAHGNPKGIEGIADLARPDVTLVNREPGAGSRMLLDSHLARLGIDCAAISGYAQLALGHLPAAWQVAIGRADACIATRAAARVFGLDFIPLVSERYDLVIAKRHLKLAGVQTLLETLGRSAFRRELEGLGGDDTHTAGDRRV